MRFSRWDRRYHLSWHLRRGKSQFALLVQGRRHASSGEWEGASSGYQMASVSATKRCLARARATELLHDAASRSGVAKELISTSSISVPLDSHRLATLPYQTDKTFESVSSRDNA